MKKPLILTDIDDCCLSWITGFRLYASRVLGYEVKGEPDHWNMQAWLGMEGTPDAAKKVADLVHDFNHGAWEFGCLPDICDSVENLRQLHFRGFDIIGITCCSDQAITEALRRANLFHVYGNIFRDVVCLPLGTPKTAALSVYSQENVRCWVEDKPSAALEGYELGYKSFLMKCGHNLQYREGTQDSPLLFVESWDEISKELLR